MKATEHIYLGCQCTTIISAIGMGDVNESFIDLPLLKEERLTKNHFLNPELCNSGLILVL
jgi:hypothetical protein